ncbi:MAG: dihydropteroate synthase [Cyclobacteriaceae bacterium]|nr:dihydropteroate synthase [Cyclobacteriaceae bacterium]
MEAKDSLFYRNFTMVARGKVVDLSKPRVMGVLNVTPDSFFDGGRYTFDDRIFMQLERMASEGADIIDIGGYSSRPGALEVSVKEELQRVLKGIIIARKNFGDVLVSVDTFRAEVARIAIAEGADIINDISAGELDQNMFQLVAELKVPYIAMHMRGKPENMMKNTKYENLVMEILQYFKDKVVTLREMGVSDVILDPGFGFSKTLEQNYKLLKELCYFKVMKLPLLVGLSRKSMIYKTLNTDPENALNGTTALHMYALCQGANILRVHDVKEAVEVINLYNLLNH